MVCYNYEQVMSNRTANRKNLAGWSALGKSIAGFTNEDLWLDERMENWLGRHCICGAGMHPPCVAAHDAECSHLRKLWNLWVLGSYDAYCDYVQSL